MRLSFMLALAIPVATASGQNRFTAVRSYPEVETGRSKAR